MKKKGKIFFFYFFEGVYKIAGDNPSPPIRGPPPTSLSPSADALFLLVCVSVCVVVYRDEKKKFFAG